MDRPHLRRRLTAVMIADVVGYSRLMSVDEESTHLRLSDYIKNSVEPKIAEHGGRLIRTAGDGLLAEFDSAVDAVYCALEFQQKLAERDAGIAAVQLDPNSARAYAQKANQLVMVGRPKEAPPLVLKAIALSPRDPYAGTFYWVIGRAYFVMQNYDDAIVWLRKAVEVRPNVWYSRAYLLAAYAHLGRHEQPEGRAALSDYNGEFSGFTVRRIRDLYEKELPHTDPIVQASIQALYHGLQKAGIP